MAEASSHGQTPTPATLAQNPPRAAHNRFLLAFLGEELQVCDRSD